MRHIANGKDALQHAWMLGGHHFVHVAVQQECGHAGGGGMTKG